VLAENTSQPDRPCAILTVHVSILSERKALTGFSAYCNLITDLAADGLLFFRVSGELLFRQPADQHVTVLHGVENR
jgi:hypothetical protein